MSRLSKLFPIASPLLFFLAFVIHQSRLWNLRSKIDEANEEGTSGEGESILVHLYSTGWDIWDDIIVYLTLAAFACIFCAILVWKRDRPHQNLFLE